MPEEKTLDENQQILSTAIARMNMCEFNEFALSALYYVAISQSPEERLRQTG